MLAFHSLLISHPRALWLWLLHLGIPPLPKELPWPPVPRAVMLTMQPFPAVSSVTGRVTFYKASSLKEGTYYHWCPGVNSAFWGSLFLLVGSCWSCKQESMHLYKSGLCQSQRYKRAGTPVKAPRPLGPNPWWVQMRPFSWKWNDSRHWSQALPSNPSMTMP